MVRNKSSMLFFKSRVGVLETQKVLGLYGLATTVTGRSLHSAAGKGMQSVEGLI